MHIHQNNNQQDILPEVDLAGQRPRSKLMPWWIHVLQALLIVELNFILPLETNGVYLIAWMLLSLWFVISCILVWIRWKYAVDSCLIPAFFLGVLILVTIVGGIMLVIPFVLYVYWLFKVRRKWRNAPRKH